MLTLPTSVRVFAATATIGPRTDVDKLVQLVRETIGEDPFSGNVFCFFSHRRDRVKLLVWDRNGFWTMCKRLERGRFESLDASVSRVEIAREQLVMLLEGIGLKSLRFRRNFAREVRMATRDDVDQSAHVAR